MPFLLTLIVGAAAGMIVVHLMNLKVNIWTSIAIGVLGAIIGTIALRFLIPLFVGIGGLASLVVAALIGAAVIVGLFRAFFNKKD